MSDPLTIEERARLSSAVADLRRLVDTLRNELAEMQEELGLPPGKTKSNRRKPTSDAID